MDLSTIQNCKDIKELMDIAINLYNENSKLKQSYQLLSARVSKIMPLIKDQLSNSDWELSDVDAFKVVDKAIDNKLSTVPKQATGCLTRLETMKIFRTSVYCCKFNSRDKVLACGCFSGSIILYRFSTSSTRLKHIRTLTGHDGLVTSINWLSDNTRIVTTSVDKTIKIWKMMTGELEAAVNINFLAMNSCLSTSLNSDIFTLVGSSNSFISVDLSKPSDIKTHNFSYQINAVTSYKHYTIAGTNDGYVLLINNSTYEIEEKVSNHGYQVQSLFVKEVDSDEWYLAVGNRNNIITVYEINNTSLKELSIPELRSAYSNCLLFYDVDISLSDVLIDTNNSETIETIEDLEEKVVANLYLIAGGQMGMLYLWPVTKQDLFLKPQEIKAHEKSICFIDYSPFCKLMATSSQDHNLKIWKVSKSK